MRVKLPGRSLLALLVAVAACQSLVASSASANHQDGIYSGPAAGGGEVEFDVQSDQIGSFTITGVQTSCGNFTFTQFGTPILLASVHSFSYGNASTIGLSYSGSFPAARQAQGTFIWRTGGSPGCASAPVAWTASLDQGDAGGERKPGASPAVRKCKKIQNKKKRKRCLKKAKKKR